MAAKFSTTTWPQRHENTFSELAEILRKSGIDSPRILEIGPGAVSRILSRSLACGEGENLSTLGNRWRALLRNIDSILRRLPGVKLSSYEPGELIHAIPKNAEIFVADISPNVISAISEQYPNVQAQVFDFAKNKFDPPLDVVVCLCVLVRAPEPEKMFTNIYHSLKHNGILVMDNRSCSNFNTCNLPLKKLTNQTWQKI